ncbi:MAG: hypothetical protein ACLQBB_04640 [Solirubrobacteraceae bacterium]
MGSYRFSTTAALIALALPFAVPAAAGASSTLLSGYGGPGEGNQAILGSTLIGGAGGSAGGGSSGGGQGGSGGPTGAGPQAAGGASSVGATGVAGAGGGASRSSGGRSGGAKASPQHASGVPSPAYRSGVLLATSQSAGSPALGLTGGDVVYIILGLGALVATAVITSRLARGSEQRGRG